MFRDDVIRIRIDASSAVRAFMDLLEAQAAEGETRAPAKPRATALYRELAPYRLVEYAYVEEAVGEVEGAYVGLPDGSVFSVADEIPEQAIDELVAGDPDTLPAVYVYVLLSEPAGVEAIRSFFANLAEHLGASLVGVLRLEGGVVEAQSYPDGVRLDLAEPDRILSKPEIVDRFVGDSATADGRAFARVTYAFARHVAVFASVPERDAFVAWSRRLCQAVTDWQALGFDEMFRAAEPARAPDDLVVTTPMPAPDDQARRAFAGGALADPKAAAAYWRRVKEAFDAAEAGATIRDGWIMREGRHATVNPAS